MAGKKSAFEFMMGNARKGSSKEKGCPSASLAEKAKEVIKESVKETIKEEADEKMEDISVMDFDVKMEDKKVITSSTTDSVAPSTKEAKRKGRPPASSVAKAKQVVKESETATIKEEVDAKMEEKKVVASTAAEAVVLLTKKETDFDPEAAAFWKPGQPVPFLFLASALDSKF